MSLGEMKISLDHSLDPGTRLCMAAATGDLEIGFTNVYHFVQQILALCYQF